LSDSPPRGVVALLTGQAFAFGVTLALLVIPANSIFLDAYGAEWLPATYVAIAVVGSAASALIARAARRTRLVRVATATLLAFAVLFAVSWPILVAGGVWMSALLLVVFPIALQVGFVFIGGQAGRLLDVRQMKELFPRIVLGFAVGFLVGGLLGIPLLALLGSTSHLLVGTTIAQLAFLGLLLETERRFPEMRAAPAGAAAPAFRRPPLRMLFASGIALLLLVYQVLSAMGSWVVDFLLFDRASARYSGDDLTEFLSAYTALLNLVDILFLALLAGPLMRRFGLRLGLLLNPVVVAGILALMLVVAAGAGTAAFGLFVLAGVVRVADIATTDGTTRTSINAAYQVVPVEERLSVQAVVEGIGVPVAIGVTGVLLLALNVLGFGTGGVIVFGLVLGAVWTVVAARVYRSYTQSLGEEMQRRSLASAELDIADDDAAALRALLRSDDTRDVRLGLDLLAGVVSPATDVEIRELAEHADPELRMRALALLAAHGDEHAAAAAAGVVRNLAYSDDAHERRAAAAAFETRGIAGDDLAPLADLLLDGDPTVRAAALDAVAPADAVDPELVRRVVSALDEPHLAGTAGSAVRRLGPAAVPYVAAALADNSRPRRASLVRAAAALAAEQGAEVIEPALEDSDRTLVLAAFEALDAAGGGALVPSSLVDATFADAADLAARAYAARGAVGGADGSLVRALDDEIDLARRLVIAALGVRYGDRVREAVRVVEHAEGQRRALGVEALDVVLTRAEAAVALPLVRRDAVLPAGRAFPPRGQEAWIADLVDDPEHVWRSEWLVTCARHASRRS
jgi:hypothetical protein